VRGTDPRRPYSIRVAAPFEAEKQPTDTEGGLVPENTAHPTNLAEAEAAVAEAIANYRRIADERAEPATEIAFTPSPSLRDDHRYTAHSIHVADHFRSDTTFVSAARTEIPSLQAVLLSLSPHWQDRIRAAALKESFRDEITLTDGFPCIYEPATSPRNKGHLRPSNYAWVISPDEEMLHELLPLYRELWGSYEDQWPHTPNRTFEVGRLNGLSPFGVYRPGTTPAEVIGQTMITHTEMYRRAPEHLQRMHPLHEQWTKDRAKRGAA
jgi:hypothetical protein